MQGPSPIRVEQATFEELTVTATSDGMCQCSVASLPKERRFQPEFVLIRQKPITDHDRNILLGMYRYRHYKSGLYFVACCYVAMLAQQYKHRCNL